MSCFRMAQLTISGHFGQHCMQKRLLSGELGSAVSMYFFPFWVKTWVKREKKREKDSVIGSGKIEDNIFYITPYFAPLKSKKGLLFFHTQLTKIPCITSRNIIDLLPV